MSKPKLGNAYESVIAALGDRADALEGLTLKSAEGHKLKAHLQGVIANAREALNQIAELEQKLEEHAVRL